MFFNFAVFLFRFQLPCLPFSGLECAHLLPPPFFNRFQVCQWARLLPLPFFLSFSTVFNTFSDTFHTHAEHVEIGGSGTAPFCLPFSAPFLYRFQLIVFRPFLRLKTKKHRKAENEKKTPPAFLRTTKIINIRSIVLSIMSIILSIRSIILSIRSTSLRIVSIILSCS